MNTQKENLSIQRIFRHQKAIEGQFMHIKSSKENKQSKLKKENPLHCGGNITLL